jgi:hypothetical protein
MNVLFYSFLSNTIYYNIIYYNSIKILLGIGLFLIYFLQDYYSLISRIISLTS